MMIRYPLKRSYITVVGAVELLHLRLIFQGSWVQLAVAPHSYFGYFGSNWFWSYLGHVSSYRHEKEHSIGKMKFCIGLSLYVKLLVGKRV